MGKGLLAVYTGNGKGKTTAALGLVFRALGHGHKVTVVQFIKGRWRCGEHILAEKFPELLDFHITGQGFTWKSADREQDTLLAQSAWELAEKIIQEGAARLIILDELTYLVRYNMVPEERIIASITNRPEGVHIVITGRYASEKLLDAADLVTEMNEVKHPYKSGVAAQKGFDF